MSTTNAPLVKVGDSAPDFTLASTAGAMVTLSAYRGKKATLLAFFPLAFTSVCTAEMCAFGEDFDQFEAAGVEVLPLSVDAIPSLKEYRSKYAMRVQLLSDFKREASRAFGVLNEDTFCSRRAYVLVDVNGIVRWVHVEEKSAQRRENAELQAAIAAALG